MARIEGLGRASPEERNEYGQLAASRHAIARHLVADGEAMFVLAGRQPQAADAVRAVAAQPPAEMERAVQAVQRSLAPSRGHGMSR